MWRNKNFLLIMGGTLIVDVGFWFGIIGNLEFLQQNIESSFYQSLFLIVGIVMAVMLAPIAGRIVDQAPKKQVIVWSSFVRIFAVCFMFAAIKTGDVWWMLMYSIFMGAAASFTMPAFQALLPIILEREQLLGANSLLQNMMTVSRIAGTALAGYMLVKVSLFSLYFITLIAYTATFVCLTFLNVNEKRAKTIKDKKKEKSSFKDVFPIFKEHPAIITPFLLVIVPYLFLAGFNLMIIEISDLQNDQSIKGTLYVVEGISVFAGSVILKKFLKQRAIVPVLLGAVTLVAVSQLTLYFADIHWMPFISFALFGLTVGVYFPVSNTIFQVEVPHEFHGRFFSFKRMVESLMFPIFMIATGYFLDSIGIQQMAVLYGAISLVIVSIYGWKVLTGSSEARTMKVSALEASK
ncbi:MFS transporter [Fictibacillus aquaticus]|nr:MFS transporter [Fictibacillus aquaticus]